MCSVENATRAPLESKLGGQNLWGTGVGKEAVGGKQGAAVVRNGRTDHR